MATRPSWVPQRWRVALDGPAASGKTTVARRVAQALGYALVDTGAMYRAVALEALRRGLDITDATLMEALAREVAAKIAFLPDAAGTEGYRLRLGDEDVTDRLHDSDVSRAVPTVAAISEVRRVLAAEQRRLGLGGGVVMTGRDIGTVVLPEAELKIYLTASLEERARRRLRDMEGRAPAEAVVSALQERDRVDSTRADSPLVQAADAFLLDTTTLPIDDVVERILTRMRSRVLPAAEPS